MSFRTKKAFLRITAGVSPRLFNCRWLQVVWRVGGCLPLTTIHCLLDLFLEGFQIADGHLAPLDLQHSFSLKTREITGYQFADRANLCCQLLVGDGESDFHARSGAHAGLLREAKQIGSKPVADSSERQFFDNSHQATKTRAHDP